MRRGLVPVLTAPVLTAALLTAALLTTAAPVPAVGAAASAPGEQADRGAQGTAVPLAVHLAASDPEISADGRWVVFVGTSEGRSRVHRLDTVTGETRVVAPALPAGEVADPSVSDDGQTVALAHRRPGEHWQVHLVDLRHDAVRRVSVTSEWEPGNGDSWAPRLSGDGESVVFTTEATDIINKPDWGAGSAAGSDVVVGRLVTEGFLITLVSPERAGVDFTGADVDTTGRRVAMTSQDGKVLVADRPTGGASVRELGPGRTPSLSADGSAVALVRPQPVHEGGPDRSATWWRPLVGGEELQVDVDDRGWALDHDSSQPRVSADGRRVLLVHHRPQGAELVLRDLTVGATTTVASGVDAAAGSDLSADGRWAVHVEDGTLRLTDVAALVDDEVVEAPRSLWSALVMRAATRARGGGYVLHAVPGRWEPVRGARVERQWLRSGRPIPGATGLSYEITRADVGRDVALREWLRVPGLPAGVSTSRAYRVKPDRARLRVPSRVVRPRPGAVRLKVRVTTQPGGETYVDGAAVPQGRVRVRVGRTTVTRKVTATGWVTVRLPRQAPGRKVVRVRHLGTPYVTSAPARKVRLVVRPRR